MTPGTNGTSHPRLRFDPGSTGRRRSTRRAAPRFRVRTVVVVAGAVGLFVAYEATQGPWRRHQVTAESYARDAGRMAELSRKEGQFAAGLAVQAAALGADDPARPALVRRAESHHRRAWFYARLAASAAAQERSYRRLSWLPWLPHPADPLPPDPLTPLPPLGR